MHIATSLRRLGLAASLTLGATAAHAAGDIALPGDRVFPESIASTADGTLYVGSPAAGGVMRIAPGGKPEMWIKPGAYDTRSTFGLLADEKSGTLWVCSNDITGFGVAGPTKVPGAYLKGFDLKTGDGKVSAALPGSPALCNDIAVAPDGSVLVTDTLAPLILVLKPGATKLDVWAQDPLFTPPAKGAGLDGIIFGNDGNIYTDLFNDPKLLRIDVKDGKPGKVTQLKTSQPVLLTDAMRDWEGSSFLMIEGSGKLDRVTIDGDNAKIDTLKDGMDGPTGVTKVGDTAYVTEGQLPKLFKNMPPTLPFKATAVPLK